MRILAIRGCNLASLAGKFEVNLDRPPLESAGLFAITGPTGSGKSTILDAMSLALFNDLPRLEGASKNVRIGSPQEEEKNWLTEQDARSILRRGTGEGWAEVEFVGHDPRVRYRARWDLQRARKKADGLLQRQSWSFQNLQDGTGVSGRYQDVGTAINAALGLDFQQFRRSVLLAQGDFAAFLRANAAERAALLERITGIEIYSQISIKAFERAREERNALAQLEMQAGVIEILSDPDRQELEESLQARQVEKAHLDSHIQRLETHQRWYDDLEKQQKAVALARDQSERARQEQQEAADQRQELDEVRATLPLRTFVEQSDRARRRLEQTRLELDAAQTERQKTSGLLDLAQQGQQQAIEVLDRSRTRLASLTPQIQKARLLDEHLSAAGLDRVAAVQEMERTSQEADAARVRAGQKQEEIQKADLLLADDNRWLEAHVDRKPLADKWQRLEIHLGDVVRKRSDLARSQASCADGKKSCEHAEHQLDRMRQKERSARIGQAEIQNEVDALAKALQSRPTEPLQQERERCAALEASLQEAIQLRRQQRQTGQSLEDQENQRSELQTKAQKARESAVLAETQRARIQEELERTKKEKELADAARTLEERRAALRPGEPCPLCGATEHPWAEGSPLAALRDEIDRQVEELSSQHESLLSDEKRHRTDEAKFQGALQAIAARIAELELQAGDLADSWREMAGKLGDALGQDPDTCDPGALESLRHETAQRATELRSEIQAIERQQGQLRELQQHLVESQKEVERCALSRQEAEQKLEQAKTGLRQAEERSAEIEREVRELMEHLEPLLGHRPSWQSDLLQDPERFSKQVANEVKEYQGRLQERDETERRSNRLRIELAPLAAELTQKAARAAQAAEQANLAATKEAQIRQERATLLDGREAATVEREAQQAVETTTAELEESRKAREQANLDLTRAEERLAAAQAALQDRQGEVQAALRSLDEQLARKNLVLDQVLRHLPRDERWIEATAARLDLLEKAVQQAQAVLLERQAQLNLHLQSGKPDLEPDQVKTGLEASHQEREELIKKMATDLARLSQDGERRQQRSNLLQAIEIQKKATDQWATINLLIGSADGAKFRRFAQSLTLDHLLREANHQLKELAPRYRLMRIPGQELDIQVVDRDLGDEVRSLRSLSGGETFLASLALALGLSSLSSNRLSIRSLFVDEGFGSLDPATLDIVLHTMDQLQAQGRQVGIISHIPGLAERIGAQVKVVPLGSGRSKVVVE
ncbi:MAG: AAA family ATPase [Bradymonadales bacterium]|nr:AAA family ATPase [Bradymonadales bacterium]